MHTCAWLKCRPTLRTYFVFALKSVHSHLHCISTGYQFRICFRYQLGLNRSLQPPGCGFYRYNLLWVSDSVPPHNQGPGLPASGFCDFRTLSTVTCGCRYLHHSHSCFKQQQPPCHPTLGRWHQHTTSSLVCFQGHSAGLVPPVNSAGL